MRTIIVLSVVVLLFVIGATALYAQADPALALAEIAAQGEVTVDFAVTNQNPAGPSLTELSVQGLVTIGSDDWGIAWTAEACAESSGFSDLAAQGTVINHAPDWVCRAFDAVHELAQLEAAGLITVARPH